MSDDKKCNVQIPNTNVVNQVLSDAIINSPGVQAHVKEAEQRLIEKRRHRANLVVALAIAFVSIVVALLIWLIPIPAC